MPRGVFFLRRKANREWCWAFSAKDQVVLLSEGRHMLSAAKSCLLLKYYSLTVPRPVKNYCKYLDDMKVTAA